MLIPVGLAAAVVAGTVAWWVWFRTPVLSGFAVGNGRLEATEADVSSKLAGRLVTILVDEGDDVVTDQLLARMDTASLRADLRAAEALIRQAREAERFARAVLEQRGAELRLARTELARFRELVEEGVVSRQEFDRYETAAETALAAHAAAQAHVVDAGAMIEARVAQADRIREDIRDDEITAPIDGRVLYRLAEPGEVLAAGGRLLSLIDLSDLHMTLFLPGADAARTHIGAEARVVLDGLEGQPLPATVSFVAPEAQFTPKEVETRTEREKLVFRLKLRIDETAARGLKPGSRGVGYVRLDDSAAWPDHLR